ncbi:MAG: AMP-binding protein [Desulfobacteraceae bacterium]|nr:AMP-binding protein [Desulfobacteraceae bacterium]
MEQSIGLFPDNPLFGTKDSNNRYGWITYKEFGSRVDNLRAGLAQLGVGKGDTVGIIANNRTEWAVAAFAGFGLGAVFSPMYEKELPRIWKHIILDSAVKVLFVSTPEIFDAVAPLMDEIDTLEKVVCIDSNGQETMAGLEKKGKASPVPSVSPGCGDAACCIYTSGTTGNPKGVMLTHGNFTSNARAGYRRFPNLSSKARSISILPWAHSYGFTAELVNFIQFGGSIGFMEKVATLADDMASLHPSFLIGVPRIFNKIYDSILSRVNEKQGITKFLFDHALAAAREKRELREQNKPSAGTNLKFALLDLLVLKKIRARFGGNLEGALTASATSNPEIAQFFEDIGIPTFDAYGMTECAPAIAMNGPGQNRFGSVGRPLEHVRIEFDKTGMESDADDGDGELIVYSPGIMMGYRNNPEKTAETLTPDGGLRTGDRGRIDKDGYLYITGRIKEQYKLENGKFVFPAALEEEINFLPYVESSMIYGDGKPYNICFVVLDMDTIHTYAEAVHLKASPEEVLSHHATLELISSEIKQHLRPNYGSYEIPKRFIFLKEGFTSENGLLTQTMKIKRVSVTKRFKHLINEAYAGDKKIITA